jgi:hypothetical protein
MLLLSHSEGSDSMGHIGPRLSMAEVAAMKC